MIITYDYLTQEIVKKIVFTIELEKYGKLKNNPKDFFIKSSKINRYSDAYFFTDFYVISYFDKLFIFNYDSYGKYLKSNNFDDFASSYAIAMILDEKKVSLSDFSNLKKCYMLTKEISYFNEKIYCSYCPYYMIKLTLLGQMLHIDLKTINAETEINMNNVNTDLATFIKDVFYDIPEEKLKMHHQILLYFANEIR